MSSTLLTCSVIVPAYNAAHTLSQTLDALCAQDVATDSFEIIVVDDGSTDHTAKIARCYNNVICLQQANAGPAAARNTGARAAHGDVILFTDADCVPASNWVRQMLEPFFRPEVTGVQGAYRTRQSEFAARFAQAEFEDRYALMQRYPSIDLVATYAAGFRRDLFLKMGGFDERFPVANNEDTEFSYRLIENGAIFIFASQALVYHRHPSTLRRYLRTKFWRAYWRMVVYQKYPHKAVRDRYTTTLLKLQTLGMLVSLILSAGALTGLISWIFPLSIWMGILASSLPLARAILPRDLPLAIATPVIIFLRSFVFAFGSVWGVAHCLRLCRKKG